MTVASDAAATSRSGSGSLRDAQPRPRAAPRRRRRPRRSRAPTWPRATGLTRATVSALVDELLGGRPRWPRSAPPPRTGAGRPGDRAARWPAMGRPGSAWRSMSTTWPPACVDLTGAVRQHEVAPRRPARPSARPGAGRPRRRSPPRRQRGRRRTAWPVVGACARPCPGWSRDGVVRLAPNLGWRDVDVAAGLPRPVGRARAAAGRPAFGWTTRPTWPRSASCTPARDPRRELPLHLRRDRRRRRHRARRHAAAGRARLRRRDRPRHRSTPTGRTAAAVPAAAWRSTPIRTSCWRSAGLDPADPAGALARLRELAAGAAPGARRPWPRPAARSGWPRPAWSTCSTSTRRPRRHLRAAVPVAGRAGGEGDHRSGAHRRLGTGHGTGVGAGHAAAAVGAAGSVVRRIVDRPVGWLAAAG